MPRFLLVYSSVTGNTRAVAEAVLPVMPSGTSIFRVQDAPDPAGFDFIALGFWVRRAAPDPLMLDYMARIQGKTVALLGTLAAWPDSPHAGKVLENAAKALEGNRIVMNFLCQGKLSPQRMALRQKTDSAGHPMTPERLARLEEAAKHPDAQDFDRARQAMGAALSDFLHERGIVPEVR
ncbi:flavodoxin family protein [Desulfovibrio sp. OttesenSCG-928-C06]|nr:flavodoxin family protein [Desulfovibrio sp. OttesenSCG-928-C06]